MLEGLFHRKRERSEWQRQFDEHRDDDVIVENDFELAIALGIIRYPDAEIGVVCRRCGVHTSGHAFGGCRVFM